MCGPQVRLIILDSNAGKNNLGAIKPTSKLKVWRDSSASSGIARAERAAPSAPGKTRRQTMRSQIVPEPHEHDQERQSAVQYEFHSWLPPVLGDFSRLASASVTTVCGRALRASVENCQSSTPAPRVVFDHAVWLVMRLAWLVNFLNGLLHGRYATQTTLPPYLHSGAFLEES